MRVVEASVWGGNNEGKKVDRGGGTHCRSSRRDGRRTGSSKRGRRDDDLVVFVVLSDAGRDHL